MLDRTNVAQLGCKLNDINESLARRFRVLFTLRNIVCNESIDAIAKSLIEDDSDLLKHECAYCMGQMKDPYAIPYLIKTIKDEQQHPMVRHEAGEALGAIGKYDEEILQLLKDYSKHKVPELSETCQLALDRLDWYNMRKGDRDDSESTSPYNSVDPTPSYPDSYKVEDLREIYLDEARTLFERYRALFTLRNIGSPEAVKVICEGLFGSKTDSALFKHEVAFVLGQMQRLDSVESLTKKLADCEENEIVRHECAEALGSIGKSEIIMNYINDKSRIVRESCQVALDMAEYENDETQFDFIENKE